MRKYTKEHLVNNITEDLDKYFNKTQTTKEVLFVETLMDLLDILKNIDDNALEILHVCSRIYLRVKHN